MLLACLLEEVLLSSALEHAAGDLDGNRVSPWSDDMGPVAALKPGGLAQAQFAVDQADTVVGQDAADLGTVEGGSLLGEPFSGYAAAFALATGQNVKSLVKELLKELGPTVKPVLSRRNIYNDTGANLDGLGRDPPQQQGARHVCALSSVHTYYDSHVHSGHRRCAALRFLGAATVIAVLRAGLDERKARKIAVTGNIGREDLRALEQA